MGAILGSLCSRNMPVAGNKLLSINPHCGSLVFSVNLQIVTFSNFSWKKKIEFFYDEFSVPKVSRNIPLRKPTSFIKCASSVFRIVLSISNL